MNKYGERGRNRTYNLVIKSHLLCQLSYAPALSGIKTANAASDKYNIRPSLSGVPMHRLR